MRMLPIVLLSAAFLFTACVHRPYYRDLVGDAAGQKEIALRLINDETNAPLANVPVIVGAGKDRISVVSDSQGVVILPVRKSLLDPFTVVEVVRPTGVGRYSFERMAAVAPRTTVETPAPEKQTVIETTPGTTTTEQTADAGM